VGSRFYPACRAILQVVLDGYADEENDDEIVIPVVPKGATIHVNSYRQADSWELVFDAGDLPFDPRIVRTGFAEIYLYQTEGLDDRNRVLSRRDPLAEPDPGAQRPRDISETLALDAGVAAKQRFTYGNKPKVAGLFDRASIELSSDGKWVTVNGQDMTGTWRACSGSPIRTASRAASLSASDSTCC
jgi:hypothetical protein